mgnify:CR=1 FL=1
MNQPIRDLSSEQTLCSYLLQLSDTIQDLAPSEIFSTALQLLKNQLTIEYVSLYQTTDLGNSYILLYEDNSFSSTTLELSEDQRKILINNHYLSVANHSYVPLLHEEKLTLVLLIQSERQRTWEPDEILIAQQTLERLWKTTLRAQKLQSLTDSEEKHRILFHSMDEGYCIIEMIHDEHGIPVDWRFLQVNPAFERHNGLKNAQGKTIKEMTPGIEPKWMFIYDSVAQSGKPLRFEEDSMALGRIFSLYAFRMRGEKPHVAVIFTDITRQRQAETALLAAQTNYRKTMEIEVAKRTAELQASKAQLQSVFDTTLVQLSILEAIRDENGAIQDFKIKLINRELERETGKIDLVGRRYGEAFPAIRDTGLLELIAKAVDTGLPQQTEYCYPEGDPYQWYACMFVSAGDTVVASYQNITAKKQVEQERYKNHLLLRQSEQLAMLGSWDYQLDNQQLHWSEGMYELYNLPPQMPVELSNYLYQATDNSRKKAKQLIEIIQNGDPSFKEILQLQINGKIKIIQIHTQLITDQFGKPERVLGTDLDVTASYLAQDKLKQLEAEKHREIVRTTFSTLEEERRRISENLHNGLAQILYGVKISLHTLSQKDNPDAFAKQLNYATELLSEAITENRRISHELMPPILEEFGLSEAIRDIVKKLQNQVKFTYRVSGITNRLEKYIKLAIYRTVQELMMNIVKHANASEALVEIVIKLKSVCIRVSDNGRGMPLQKTTHDGIGLASIRSKIKLLNGHMDIQSNVKGGTAIKINFPINCQTEK